MFEDIQSFFTTRPKRPASSLGAGASAEDDPAMPAFRKAWKDGALVEDLFGPSPFPCMARWGAAAPTISAPTSPRWKPS
ncbi:hypothetical protein [Magnetospirillum molischianum]|uniref:Uncharacterized protein n=1 Tax=Magnetospirillum molischianum DSM 120 TaxID=1150626 RepID=H8FQQ0_MAGML|nr:hypothetical protein [Magnetospirillum molischianum]CCG40688.1 hypothetical protein PHAMO_210199 [Magnetospirillum molischianum DSM 120]